MMEESDDYPVLATCPTCKGEKLVGFLKQNDICPMCLDSGKIIRMANDVSTN